MTNFLRPVACIQGHLNASGLELRGRRLAQFCKKALSPVTGVSPTAAIVVGTAVTAAGLACAAFLYFAGILYVPGKGWNWLLFDEADMDVYFSSASWIIEGGHLYREAASVYPLFANFIFAILRYLSNLLHSGIDGFYGLWVVSTWIVYLYAVYRIATGTTMLAALAWLAPAPIYFAIFRYDIYPAVATLMSLFAIRRTHYLEGAIWLGVAVALKGYALWLLPVYCVFMFYQRGFAAAVKVGALAVTPMIVCLLATLTFTGWEGIVAPLKFHALRTLNGESSYDALNYLFSVPVVPDGSTVRWVAQFLQVGCALAAAAMRPRKFDDLANSFLFAVLGFMSFSVFYSPQYVLWVLPLVCFSRPPVVIISAICLSWVTYLYNPVGWLLYQQYGYPNLYKAAIIAVSSLRLFMMFLAVREYFKHQSVTRDFITAKTA